MRLKSRAVLVVGAGIAGIQASLDLAEMGLQVHLVEETSTIGGRMPQLDKTFPTNDCSMCILAPKMSECAGHNNITIHIKSSIQSVTGKPGNFTATILEESKFVDADKCVACGLCEEKCPVKTEDVFDEGLRKRGAISRYFLQSIPSEYTIDKDKCLYLTKGVCKICQKVCPADAIYYEDEDKEISVEVGAVIVANGMDPFDPIGLGHFGHKRHKNVVTALEFERMLSASGPLGGHVVRATDKKEPESIAFIQCVGSRDESIDHNYCSSACCMFAIKEAIIAKEHIKQANVSIFYMDIRAYGKEFDKYFEKAKNQYNVDFIRSKVAEIVELDNGDLDLKYVLENGKIKHSKFDLVVLSIGLQPRNNVKQLAEKLDIKLNEYGFIHSNRFSPVSTSREGIYVCGTANGPKDIPESVITSSGAVAAAIKYLRLERQELEEKKSPELLEAGDRPRIGTFICHCGINIAGVVDVKDVAKKSGELQYVEHSEDLIYACSQDCMNTMKKRIKEKNLNRVVVAACTPRTHEPLFREMLSEAGLNPYLFEMANIRDQCSWAHMDEPEKATEKSKDLVEMGVAKARGLTSLKRLPIEINPKALVIGGGLAGMTAAKSLAEAEHQVYLIEKEELGGNLQNIFYNFGSDPQKLLEDLTKEIENNKYIHVHKNVEIVDIDGYIGNFKTTINNKDANTETTFEHGIIIVATGADEHKPDEYLYDKSDRIITQVEFERMLHEENFPREKFKNVVMIQCVGSRQEDRMYCSRICCTKAVKNSLTLKKKFPQVNIFVAYRDIRTYGFREKYYTQLRDEGAMFINYSLEQKPMVELADAADPECKIDVTVFDPIIDKKIEVSADLVVLATAIDSNKDNEKLSKMLKIPLNADGMFMEAHVKLRPVDFATDGIFLTGLAHSPKDMDESIAQSQAAASRALTFLNKKEILADGTIAEIDESRCSGCGYCEDICAYSAIEIDPEKEVAVINDALCKGCGACVASCRCGALDLRGFSNEQLFAAFDALEMTDVLINN